MNEMLNRLGMNAKAAETEMRNLSTNKKNEVLLAVADKLVKGCTDSDQCQQAGCGNRKKESYA